jgi:hypothetical protein
MRRVLTILAAGGISGLLVGCAQPYAAATNRPMTDAEQSQRWLLNEAQQREVKAVMTTLAHDHQPIAPPQPAEYGVRWSDVPMAAHYAAMEVEMAIVQRQRQDDQWRFTLRSANERPAVLIVQREQPPTVYSATATVGLFEDDVSSAAKLLEAFDVQMRAFGAKRAFD